MQGQRDCRSHERRAARAAERIAERLAACHRAARTPRCKAACSPLASATGQVGLGTSGPVPLARARAFER